MQEQKYVSDLEPGEAFEDELNTVPTDEEIQQRYLDSLEVQSKNQAAQILKKNRKEITRLTKHAQAAVLENNYEAYAYAVRKLRTIYRQPFNEELIQVGWQTTRKTVWEIINAKAS